MIKERKIFSYYQQKAWNYKLIMKLWISEVWRKYSHFEIQKDAMFVIDDAFIHKIKNIKQKIKDNGTKLSIISRGLTRYLQPYDILIHKPFKDELRKKIF